MALSKMGVGREEGAGRVVGEGVTQNVRGMAIGSTWTRLSSWDSPPGRMGLESVPFLLPLPLSSPEDREDSPWPGRY